MWRIFICIYFSARQEEKYMKIFEIIYKKQLSIQAKKDIASKTVEKKLMKFMNTFQKN